MRNRPSVNLREVPNVSFDRQQMLEAFDEIGNAAITAGTRLDIAVFGGSALVLASMSAEPPKMTMSSRVAATTAAAPISLRAASS